ncbi:MAG: hypothetical protein DHS20C20_02070 [Ardenticatenaceae bacterium]|nr:MAG: hypothetical protein DHS20C20_02070 [Ardenticatenaceae bacterium]
MITFKRSATIAQGVSGSAALELAVKIATYLRDEYGTNHQVHLNVGGQQNQIHWTFNTESLAEFEALSTKVVADPDYQALLAEAADPPMFRNDTVVDTLYRSVP